MTCFLWRLMKIPIVTNKQINFEKNLFLFGISKVTEGKIRIRLPVVRIRGFGSISKGNVFGIPILTLYGNPCCIGRGYLFCNNYWPKSVFCLERQKVRQWGERRDRKLALRRQLTTPPRVFHRPKRLRPLRYESESGTLLTSLLLVAVQLPIVCFPYVKGERAKNGIKSKFHCSGSVTFLGSGSQIRSTGWGIRIRILLLLFSPVVFKMLLFSDLFCLFFTVGAFMVRQS